MIKKEKIKFLYALSLAWQLGFLISVPIICFLFLGLLMDRFLNTSPYFLIFGLVLGLVMVFYDTYHFFFILLKKE